ncbi:unnamed protein product [Boreogadus saida]
MIAMMVIVVGPSLQLRGVDPDGTSYRRTSLTPGGLLWLCHERLRVCQSRGPAERVWGPDGPQSARVAGPTDAEGPPPPPIAQTEPRDRRPTCTSVSTSVSVAAPLCCLSDASVGSTRSKAVTTRGRTLHHSPAG